MPSAGATASLHLFGALALAAAEVLGGAVATRVLTGKPVIFSVEIFPFDLRAGAQVFGSPENMLFQMLRNDLNRFYGWPWDPSFGNIHVMSKLPDAQSGADKAAIMALGAFLGARGFGSAGTLSLDDIFSPVQLLVDCEIRDWVQRAIQGVWMGEEAVDDWLAEIRDGVERSFIALDSTLDYYKRHTWYPRHFERRGAGPWLAEGQPLLNDRLRGYTGMIRSRHPKRVIPHHTVPPNQHVLHHIVHGVTHVKSTCHVGQGHHDDVGICPLVRNSRKGIGF